MLESSLMFMYEYVYLDVSKMYNIGTIVPIMYIIL